MSELHTNGDQDSATQTTKARRVAAVLVTHGQVATELLAAAETIVGALNHVAAVSIGWHDDSDAAHAAIRFAMERVGSGGGVLLLTDMFGGTPTNIAAMFLDDANVEVVTGVNLPMLIKFASAAADEPLAQVARRVRDGGRDGIHLAGELLAPRESANAREA